MTLPAFWIGVAALISLEHAMRVWTHVPHRWVSHSLGSVGGAFVVAWGCGSPCINLLAWREQYGPWEPVLLSNC